MKTNQKTRYLDDNVMYWHGHYLMQLNDGMFWLEMIRGKPKTGTYRVSMFLKKPAHMKWKEWRNKWCGRKGNLHFPMFMRVSEYLRKQAKRKNHVRVSTPK